MSTEEQVSVTEQADSMTREQLENELKQNQTLSPEDIAAAFFRLEYPRFKGMLNILSRNELERLCLNLAGGHLVPVQNQLKSEKEKSAYYLGAQMAENLVIMRLSAEMEKAENAQRILQENKEKEQQTQTGETNV